MIECGSSAYERFDGATGDWTRAACGGRISEFHGRPVLEDMRLGRVCFTLPSTVPPQVPLRSVAPPVTASPDGRRISFLGRVIRARNLSAHDLEFGDQVAGGGADVCPMVFISVFHTQQDGEDGWKVLRANPRGKVTG